MSLPRRIAFACLMTVGIALYTPFLLLFLALWAAVTLSCIGPLLQLVASASDSRLLNSCIIREGGGVADDDEQSPARCVQLVETGGRTLAVRFTLVPGSVLPPVCIPNGLGATLVTISTLHERLVALGFSVLSYDRAGVGMSGPRLPSASEGKRGPKHPHAGAEEVVADMAALLSRFAPQGPTQRWILVGPSMGSIVAQAFIAAHPDRVCAFLNMDGFPFPFAAKRPRFEWAAVVYRVYAAIIWTGALRPFLRAVSFKKLASRAFSEAVVRAQMNQREFFASLGAEMLTMMDLADGVRAAWGSALDIQSLPPQQLEPLVNMQPSACGNIATPPAGSSSAGGGEGGWQEGPRSAFEHVGTGWTSREEAVAALREIIAGAATAHAEGGGVAVAVEGPLAAAFPRIQVAVMSARNYDFGWPISLFYDQQMQDFAAAEHNLHVLMAAPGATRTVFPTRSHMDMFFGSEGFIADQVAALAKRVEQQQGAE